MRRWVKRQRAAIFGGGSAGKRAWEALRRRYEIVAFADNDPHLHGTRIFEVPVVAAETLKGMELEVVFLASMFHEEIRRQLLAQGWTPGRLRLAPEFRTGGKLQTLGEVMRARGVPFTRNDWRLWRLRNQQRGRRAFLIGNGPSLRMEDLDRLASRRELCLASNKIFLAFERTTWRPDIYGIQDPDTPKQAQAEIERSISSTLFLAEYLAPHFGYGANRVYFRLLSPVEPPARPGFSTNLLRGVCCGRTITYPLLQLAAWLGVSEVILLGVDFSYANVGPTVPHPAHRDVEAYTYSPDTQTNYFVRDYHRAGEQIMKPYLEHQRLAYEAARAWSEAVPGRMRIRNASRGGRLEVFDRISFDALF